jgi:hypothetical protein
MREYVQIVACFQKNTGAGFLLNAPEEPSFEIPAWHQPHPAYRLRLRQLNSGQLTRDVLVLGEGSHSVACELGRRQVH